MKKFRVLKNGIETNAWTSDFAGKDYYEPGFGKPQREVKDASDEEKATALSSREVVDELTGETVTMWTLPSDFVVVEEDLAPQIAAEKAKRDARLAKLQTIKALKGQPKNAVNRNQFIDWLMDEILDEDSGSLSLEILKLTTQTR